MGDTNGDTDDREDVEEGEEDTDASEQDDESSSEEGADDASDDDADDDEGNSDEDEPDDDDESDDGSSKKSKKGEGKDDEEDEDDDADEEPPTRKPRKPADFVALRRGKQAAKSKDGKGKEGDKGGDADDGDEDEDGLNPKDAAAIDKRVAKALAPVLAKEEQSEVETQIAAFTSQNPDFKPFAAKVQKWALHDAWKNVPIKQIFYAAAGDKLMQLGAKRGKAADDKAKKGRTGGGAGDEGGSKSWKDAPLEDVGKEIERVKLGGK